MHFWPGGNHIPPSRSSIHADLEWSSALVQSFLTHVQIYEIPSDDGARMFSWVLPSINPVEETLSALTVPFLELRSCITFHLNGTDFKLLRTLSVRIGIVHIEPFFLRLYTTCEEYLVRTDCCCEEYICKIIMRFLGCFCFQGLVLV